MNRKNRNPIALRVRMRRPGSAASSLLAVRRFCPLPYRRSIAFLADSAVLLLSRSSISRKFLQYSQFGSEQYGGPDLTGWCGTGWLAIF